MSRAIGVYDHDELEWHMHNPGPTDHVTACGLDGADESLGQRMGPEPKRGQKITCGMCRQVFEGFQSMKMRKTHFQTN